MWLHRLDYTPKASSWTSAQPLRRFQTSFATNSANCLYQHPPASGSQASVPTEQIKLEIFTSSSHIEKQCFLGTCAIPSVNFNMRKWLHFLNSSVKILKFAKDITVIGQYLLCHHTMQPCTVSRTDSILAWPSAKWGNITNITTKDQQGIYFLC